MNFTITGLGNVIIGVICLYVLAAGGASTFSALAQSPTGEVVKLRPKNPPVNEAAAARAERASRGRSRPASISDQIELAIKRGNRAVSNLELIIAEKWYRRALALNPNEPRGYFGLGDVYWFWSGQDRWAEARNAYKEAIRLKPDYAEAYFALAQGYYIRGGREQSEAIEPFKQALRLDPNNYMANYDLGNIYFSQKRYDDALEQFQRMVQLKPNWDAYHMIGKIHAVQERYDAAIKAYKQSLGLASNTAAQFDLGIVYFQQRKYSEAIEQFKNSIRLKISPAESHYNLGLVYLYSGNKSAAKEQYEALKQLKSDYASELLKAINE